MTSVEFGKKCRPHNIRYRELFGYVPCRGDYRCTQDEYYAALLQAIETKRDIAEIIPLKERNNATEGKRYKNQ